MKKNGDEATEMKLLRLKKMGEYSKMDVNILGRVSERKIGIILITTGNMLCIYGYLGVLACFESV